MQVVATNQTPTAEENQPELMPVRLHPADAMEFVVRLANTPGSLVDLNAPAWDKIEEERHFRTSKKGFDMQGIGVFKIRGSGEKSHARLALHADGTWEIWTKIDV